MFAQILKSLFGSANDRFLKKTHKTVESIRALEPMLEQLTDEQLRAKTEEFKERLQKGETLDDLLVEAFAVVREAGKRVYGMRVFDVQMIGGIVLHKGMISEMKTGVGKTFVATLAVYLNALSGGGVHLVTVNDYLAKRDAAWAGKLYNFLGLSVGCIVHGLMDEQRRSAYNADITYGTNHEFGFDYLRDNMKFHKSDMVQRPFNFAIVDEADSILIDEARTPLIISGSAEDSSDLYGRIDVLIRKLEEGDVEKDEKQKSVMLTESGIEKMEQLLRDATILRGETLYDVQNISVVHHINSALRAHKMFARDVDYIVKDGKIVIIDEFTGRMMEGRRYSDGLHQALEAKEGVEVEMENQTLASITYQNYFRLYKKLGCMTGTAMTEAAEFEEIYKLRVIEIPTNVPAIRLDHEDDVYLTEKEKLDAVIKLIKECNARRQPVLVGTISIEKSEQLSKLLKMERIPHQVLNARQHEQESLIIEQAGCPGVVTIATNMAGRGTDIKLGGNLEMRLSQELSQIEDLRLREEREQEIRAQHAVDAQIVREAGGLFVMGTERHESRRIDNQLRGRAGRQGDPGGSKFYVSLEDDLMRIFGSERLDAMLRRLGVKEGEAISHTWISKALQRAQQKVEARNFDIRKHLLRYDDVMNDQRKVVYQQRLELMGEADVKEMVDAMRNDVIDDLMTDAIPENSLLEHWDLEGLEKAVDRLLGLHLPIKQWAENDNMSEREIREKITVAADAAYAKKEEASGTEHLRHTEKSVLLRTLDTVWKEHLLVLDHLRQGINLRAYAQNNPLNEYKREAFNLFQVMLRHLREDVTNILSRFDASHTAPSSIENIFTPHIDLSKLKELLPEWLGADEELKVPSSPDILNPVTRAFSPTPMEAEVVKRPRTRRQPVKAANSSSTSPKASSSAPEVDEPKEGSSSAKAKPKKASSKTKKEEASVGKENFNNVQRNANCPCGSGKKFKHCHGAIDNTMSE